MPKNTSQHLQYVCDDDSNVRATLSSSPDPYRRKYRPELQDGQEDIVSYPNTPSTPSMTLDSSRSGRSASSSIVPCDDCQGISNQCECLGQGDIENLRIHGQDGDYTGSPMTPAAYLSRLRFELGGIGTGQKAHGAVSTLPDKSFRSTSSGETSLLPENPRSHPGTIDVATAPSEMEVCANLNQENSDSEISGSDEDEDDDIKDEDDDWSGPGGDIEAMVLEILGSEDLAFAVDLIPLLHRAYYCQSATIFRHKFDPWCKGITQCAPGAAAGTGSGQAPSSTSQSNTAVGNSRKRQRTSDPSRQIKKKDEEEDEDEDDEENQNTREMGEPENDGSRALPRLACPFYKLDPTKYCTQCGNDESTKSSEYYRTCEGPGFKNIQRLKEHIKRKHYPVQCDRCYHIFLCSDRAAGIRLLVIHRQSTEICDRKDPSLKEGISDAQCADLDKKKGNKKGPPLSRVEKYWEIWNVLFPGVPRPPTPWYDGKNPGKRHPGPLSQESSKFSDIFNNMLRIKVTQQHIRFPTGFEAEMHDKVQILALKAFEFFVRLYGSPSAATTNSSSTSSFQQSSLLGGPYEQVSSQRTPDRWTPTTPSRSSDLNSLAFSGDIRSSPSVNSMTANTRRHSTRPSLFSSQQISQPRFAPNQLNVVPNQQTAESSFGAGVHNMSAYSSSPFPDNTSGGVDENWLQQYGINFPGPSPDFDGTHTTTGYEVLENMTMPQAMIPPPNPPNMDNWDPSGGRRRLDYNRPS